MTNRDNWDVIVIGAGPAGSRAAAAAAESGARTLLLDAKRNIGERPHCGEYAHEGLFEQFDLSEASVIGRVSAIRAFSLSLDPAVEPELLWNYPLSIGGRMIDRARFDRDLARKAASCGATVISSARLVRRDEKRWVVRFKGSELVLESRWTVAADGALSTVASILGMDKLGTAVGLQVEVPLLRSTDEISLYFSRDFVGGYGWLFPKGKAANVGVLTARKQGIRPSRLLDSLVGRLERLGLIGGGVLATYSGVIPVSGMRTDLVRDNVIFCGDAAGLAHPITGAGIFQAVISGDLAGRAAAGASKSGSADAAFDYERTLGALFGAVGEQAAAQREAMISRWEEAGFEELVKDAWFAHSPKQSEDLSISSYLGGITDPSHR